MPPVSPPVGWTKGLQIDISSSEIPDTVSNVPVPLTSNAFTSTFLDALKSDGSDLRFTSDAAGTNLLARDIQYFDQVTGNIIVHVKIDSVTASTTKTIYAWASNANALEPLLRDTSGQQSAWNDVFGEGSYYGICHFQKGSDSGTLFPISDDGFKAGFESSGNWTPVNAGSGVDDGVGPLAGQNAWVLSNSNNIINLEAIDTQNSNNTRAHWFEFWIYTTAYPSSNAPIFVGDFNRFLKWGSNGRVKFGDSGSESTNGIVLNQWNQVVLSRDSSGNVTFYLNGQTNGTTSTTQDIETMNRIFQDRNNTGNGYNGARIVWLRVCRGTTFTGSHIGIQWNAFNNASTFATPSNETDFSTPAVLTIDGLISGGVLSIFDNEDSDPQFLGTLIQEFDPCGTSETLAHSGTTNSVIVQFFAQGYEEIWQTFTLGSQDQTLTLLPKIEENL